MLSKFTTGLDSYLSKDQVKALTPVAFATTPTSDKVSGKYLHVNTETIIDDLEKLGWKPVTASQRKARKSDKTTIFSKHMVSFQNPDLMIKGKNGDDAFPRIILTNSHDGFNSFQFRIGIYRLVCSNGLVVADEEFSAFRIRHTGYTFEELRGVVSQAVTELPNKVQILNQMQLRELTPVEQRQLAIDAMQLRTNRIDAVWDDETIQDVLTPIRDADKGNDLWKVFNVIQEKITQGGYSAALNGTKVRKVRKIKSFEKDLEVNQKLFKLATALIN